MYATGIEAIVLCATFLDVKVPHKD